MFSGWLKTSKVAGLGGGAQLSVTNGAGWCDTPAVSGDSDWNLQALEFTTGPSTTSVTVGIVLGLMQGGGRSWQAKGSNSGSAWFDGLQLVEKSLWENSYKYDLNGNFVTESAGSLGNITSYRYNKTGLPVSSTVWLRATNETYAPLRTDYTYDNAGRQTKALYPAAQTGAPRGELTATYDKAGNMLTQSQMHEQGASSYEKATYTYNALGHKISEEDPHGQLFTDSFASAVAGANPDPAWSPQHASQWTIPQAGIYQGTAPGSWNREMSVTGTPSLATYIYEASVKVISGFGAGLIIHSTGEVDKNLVLVELAPSDNGVCVWKADGSGQWSQLYADTSFAPQLGTLYRLRMNVSGATATVFISSDGGQTYRQLFGGSLDLGSHSQGKVGLALGGNASSGGTAQFSNVSLTETGQTTYSYDVSGRLIGISANKGDNTFTTYNWHDGLGRTMWQYQHSQDYAVSAMTKYTYDELGNMLTKTDPKGNVTRFVYDSGGVV